MKTKNRWTLRLALLPFGLLVVGAEVMAQAAKTAHDVAERELDQLFEDDECCGGDETKDDGEDD